MSWRELLGHWPVLRQKTSPDKTAHLSCPAVDMHIADRTCGKSDTLRNRSLSMTLVHVLRGHCPLALLQSLDSEALWLVCAISARP